jgi:hypothetical protein
MRRANAECISINAFPFAIAAGLTPTSRVPAVRNRPGPPHPGRIVDASSRLSAPHDAIHADLS